MSAPEITASRKNNASKRTTNAKTSAKHCLRSPRSPAERFITSDMPRVALCPLLSTSVSKQKTKKNRLSVWNRTVIANKCARKRKENIGA